MSKNPSNDLEYLKQYCVLAYKIPLKFLDGILEWMPSVERQTIHWIVVSGDVQGMQSFNSIWADRVSLALCILPDTNCSTDEIVFDLLCAEWPSNMSSVLLLTCKRKQPEGSLRKLDVLEIESHMELGDVSKSTATEICMLMRNGRN